MSNTTPASLNDLNATSYDFKIQGKNAFNFFVLGANLPGIALGRVDQYTPVGAVNHPGDHQYEELVIDFMVDENLESWKEIYDWIKLASNIGNQDDYDIEEIRKDGILTLTSNSLNVNMVVSFWGLIPTSLTGLTFDSRDSSATTIISSVTFAYMKYELEIVP